tara:strand:+ start:1491 stop:2174 length:684 start_codon:yes stop_codon:yes gene_type:complete
MKLNRKLLRKMILSEVKKTLLKESQLQKILKPYGIGHTFTPQQLIDAINAWLAQNVYKRSKVYDEPSQSGYYSEPVSAPDILRSKEYDWETDKEKLAPTEGDMYIGADGQEYREYPMDKSPHISPIGDLFISALENLRKGKGAHTTGKDPLLQSQIEDTISKIDPRYGGSSGGWMSSVLRQADPTGEKQRSGLSPSEISDTYRRGLYRNDPSNPFFDPNRADDDIDY